MPYPIITDVDANLWYNSWKSAGDPNVFPQLPTIGTCELGKEENWDGIAAEIIEKLETIYDRVDGQEADLSNDRFEAEASVLIHKSLPRDEALSDPEFWIWFAVSHGALLVRRRYPSSEKKPFPDKSNFTSSNARETLYYRLWVRAELARDPELADQYELAWYGDIDFWRSHVLRQMSSEAGPILSALIHFQHPNGPDGEKRLKQGEVRDLIKHLKRAAANVMVEAMDNDAAKDFVEEQWNKVERKNLSQQDA